MNIWIRSSHLPMLSAEQNDSQSEEIYVIDESQAENRPLFVQEAEIWWKKVSLIAVMFVVLSGRSRDNARTVVSKQAGDCRGSAGYLIVCRRLLWS